MSQAKAVFTVRFLHANGEIREPSTFADSAEEAVAFVEHKRLQEVEAHRKNKRSPVYIVKVLDAHLFVPDDVIEEEADDYGNEMAVEREEEDRR